MEYGVAVVVQVGLFMEVYELGVGEVVSVDETAAEVDSLSQIKLRGSF